MRSALGRTFAFTLFLLSPAALCAAEAPRIDWRTDAAPRVVVEVSGVPPAILRAADPSTLLRVFAEQSGATAAMPPINGTWSVEGDRVRFEPRFALDRGVRYRAEYRPDGGAPVVSFFALPSRAAAPTTAVSGIFPSAEVLPENQLKFYVQFSGPMSRGDAYARVQLRDPDGHAIELAFLELDEELWDPAMTRLTLLIDPGRIKRGVKPLVDIGPVFEEGKRYTLAIGREWRDAGGEPLRAPFEKAFRIGPADRTPPDPARWKMQTVRAGSREPVLVEFGEPMDQALALRLITVRNFDGQLLAGETALEDQERRWSFTPAQPWVAGLHMLVVATTIEDLAGNNIGKPFDVDVFERVDRRVPTETVQVSFDVK
ncbi:MAG TPA: hypothetical protein VM029_04435 [Opitutaceae bacterium]|nr:hypothetical protein [Opitutaceae bacterium]